MIEHRYDDYIKSKEDDKVKQFESFYFFTADIKKQKKEIFAAKKAKYENQQYLKNQRLDELKNKHRMTMQKIDDIVVNCNNIKTQREHRVRDKKRSEETKLIIMKEKINELSHRSKEKGIMVLSKQMDSFDQACYKSEISEMQANAIKKQKILLQKGFMDNQLKLQNRIYKEMDSSILKLSTSQRKELYKSIKRKEAEDKAKKAEEERRKREE